jgi:hypothetical protein
MQYNYNSKILVEYDKDRKEVITSVIEYHSTIDVPKLARYFRQKTLGM